MLAAIDLWPVKVFIAIWNFFSEQRLGIMEYMGMWQSLSPALKAGQKTLESLASSMGISCKSLIPQESAELFKNLSLVWKSVFFPLSITGDQARTFFLQSGLPSSILAEIW